MVGDDGQHGESAQAIQSGDMAGTAATAAWTADLAAMGTMAAMGSRGGSRSPEIRCIGRGNLRRADGTMPSAGNGTTMMGAAGCPLARTAHSRRRAMGPAGSDIRIGWTAMSGLLGHGTSREPHLQSKQRVV